MQSVDTNVLARYVLADDPKQTPIARRVIAEGVYVTLTVALETSWLLGSRAALDRSRIVEVFESLLETDSIQFEGEDHLHWALERYRNGADLADLVHIIASRRTDGFATFEKSMAKRAGTGCPVPVFVLS